MKKYLIICTIIFILITGFGSMSLSQKKQINNLLLQNIECLATPENLDIECIGIGSLDCPGEIFKVKLIW